MTTWEAVTPLVDDEPNRRYWRQFKVGDRVRIRLNGECRADWPLTGRARVDFIGHADLEDGRIGTVERCADSGVFPCIHGGLVGHGIPVRVDTPFVWDGTEWGGGHYAACELEPLS